MRTIKTTTVVTCPLCYRDITVFEGQVGFDEPQVLFDVFPFEDHLKDAHDGMLLDELTETWYYG